MKRNYGKRTIKSAVDEGWVVKSSEVPEALDMFVEYFGEETAVDEIARSMGTDTLNDNLDWVIRQWGFAEDVVDMDNSWDKYEYAKEVMGVHELFENLTGAAGYDELAEDLAFIFRQYDFREWDERNEIESSRKTVKSAKKKAWKHPDEVAKDEGADITCSKQIKPSKPLHADKNDEIESGCHGKSRKSKKKKAIKSSSSYEDAFTVYPWDSERVTPTSDEDLGLSYAIEVYGDELVNVSDDELDAMKDGLARYFDEDAFVRDWNINASGDDEKIDSFYDIYSDPDELDIEQLSRYFDYDAFGRDIRLEYNMVWDNKRECWFSARDVDSFENEDDIVFLGNSRKQVKSGRYDEVDPHAVEDLYLTTINDGEIYHRFIMPTIENLRKHHRRGQYDRNKAMISWMRVADEGAKQYDRDFGSGRGSVTMFSPATRKKVAEKMASYYEENVMEGAVESSRKIGSSTYKVFPTENEDTYQYYPFNNDIEADEFCKQNGYTHYEKVNDRSFEDDFDNIIREF